MKTNKTKKQELIEKRKFAALFTAKNSGTLGDIDASNAVLGTAFDLCDADVRRFVEENGVVVPECGVRKATLLPSELHEAMDDAQVLDAAAKEQEDKWRADFTMPDPDAAKDEWCKKYKTLEPIINDIALGKVKASAAQARILSNIEQRCYGPIVKEQEAQAKSGVMLLPTIGSGSEMMVCPKCGYVHQVEEAFEGDEEAPIELDITNAD